jgi:hypothetical protein
MVYIRGQTSFFYNFLKDSKRVPVLLRTNLVQKMFLSAINIALFSRTSLSRVLTNYFYVRF